VFDPPYSPWNLTSPAAGDVNLAELSFNFGESPGALPPDPWSMLIVDISNGPESVQVDSPLAVSPA
jgi:hypothetical protein